MQLSDVEAALSDVQTYMNQYYYLTAASYAKIALAEANILLDVALTDVVIPEYGNLHLYIIFIGLIGVFSLIYVTSRRRKYGETL